MRLDTSTNGFAIIVCAIAILSGCTKSTPMTKSNGKNFQPITNLSPSQAKQKEKAVAAKDKLFQSLMGELTKSMSDKGPANSISVCKTRAPEIAAAVSQETGVLIGRTSFKLRNANNTAPDWAAGLVKERVETEAVVALPNDKLGVLLPIRLKATCILCHGTDEQLMPEVKAAIASDYPNDQATGFAEGDLRGYFWVEVPGESAK